MTPDGDGFGLEGMFKQKEEQILIKTYDPTAVLQQVKEKKRFIPVDDNFPADVVPDDYVLTHSVFRGKKFSVLMPRQAFWYMANPGEGGDVDSALDEISGLYEDVKEFEKELMVNGKTIPQEVDWATVARESYETYIINKLAQRSSEEDEYGDPVPQFDEKVLKELGLNDSYIEKCAKGIAAIVLGKSAEEMKKSGLKDLLRHVTVETKVQETIREKISDSEFRKITQFRYFPMWQPSTKAMRCLADSHYDLKPEYANDSEWDYNLERMTRTKKVDRAETLFEGASVDKKVIELEAEIEKRRKAKGLKDSIHARALTRQYVNLAYITRENPAAQLDIMPANGEKKENREAGNEEKEKSKQEGGKEK